MTRRHGVLPLGAVLAALALLAGGCGPKMAERPNLPMACETNQCICTEADKFVWQKGEKSPVLWRSTGEAYCPEGYLLRLADK